MPTQIAITTIGRISARVADRPPLQINRPSRPPRGVAATECEHMPAPDHSYFTIWTIYHDPDDYPGRWVLRAHDIFPDTGMRSHSSCFVAATLDEVRAKVPAGCTCVGRTPEDHPVIYESWLAEAVPSRETATEIAAENRMLGD